MNKGELQLITSRERKGALPSATGLGSSAPAGSVHWRSLGVSPNWSSQWGGGRFTSGARGSLTVGTDTCGQQLGDSRHQVPRWSRAFGECGGSSWPCRQIPCRPWGLFSGLTPTPCGFTVQRVHLGDKNSSLRFPLVPPHSLPHSQKILSWQG